MSKKGYYVVWKGHKTGIFNSWEECKVATENYKGGAKFKKFGSLEQAQQALSMLPDFFIGKSKANESVVFSNMLVEIPKQGLAVDAACSGNPGDMEYRGIDLQSNRLIFHQGIFKESTNNIGEFLAIVHALAYLSKIGDTRPIYSDSQTAINWVKVKECRTQLKPTNVNKHSFELIQRALQWLRNNSYNNAILKWNTKKWGEIPADFNRK